MSIDHNQWKVKDPQVTLSKMIRKALRGRPIPMEYTAIEWFQSVTYEVEEELKRRCKRKYGDDDCLSRIGDENWTLGYVKLIVRCRITDLYVQQQPGSRGAVRLWSDCATSSDAELALHDVVEDSPKVTIHEDFLLRLRDAENMVATSSHKYAPYWVRLLAYCNDVLSTESQGLANRATKLTQPELAQLLGVPRATYQRILYALRDLLASA